MSMVVGGLKKKNGQSLVCFMWLRVEEKKNEQSLMGFRGVVVEHFPFYLFLNAVKVRQNTNTFPSSRSGMLTTAGIRKNNCITHRFVS